MSRSEFMDSQVAAVESLGYEVLATSEILILARYGEWYGFGFSEDFDVPEEFPMLQCGDLESVIDMLELYWMPETSAPLIAALKKIESEG